MPKASPEINLAGIKLSRLSDTPLYFQLYEQFREMILNRRLRSGDRLPATRILARQIGVSRTIITQSFEQLILEGYLVGKTGSGTYVASSLPDQLLGVDTPESFPPRPAPLCIPTQRPGLPLPIAEFISSRQEVVPFLRGMPAVDLFPYQIWAATTNKVVKKLKYYHLGYENTLGYEPLRRQIADYLRLTRAVHCEPSQVVIVTGSQQAMNLAVQFLLKRGDPVWMEDPGFQGAKAVFLQGQLSINYVPLEEDGLDVRYLEKHCQEWKLGFVTPSHQYPTGSTLSLKKRLQLLDFAHQNNMWILEDDYDSEFRYQGKPLASLQGLDKKGVVIYTGTFSKVLFPGLRVAYLVLPTAELAQKLKYTKAILDRQTPILDQLILTQFMHDGHFLRHIRKMRLVYEERQAILMELIRQHLSAYLTAVEAPAGMNLICRLSPFVNPSRLREEAQKKGLVLSFLSDYTTQHQVVPSITLGYTAFSKYRLRTGVETLALCLQKSVQRSA